MLFQSTLFALLIKRSFCFFIGWKMETESTHKTHKKSLCYIRCTQPQHRNAWISAADIKRNTNEWLTIWVLSLQNIDFDDPRKRERRRCGTLAWAFDFFLRFDRSVESSELIDFFFFFHSFSLYFVFHESNRRNQNKKHAQICHLWIDKLKIPFIGTFSWCRILYVVFWIWHPF